MIHIDIYFRCIFRTLPHISDGAFKKLLHRCLTEFWIRLCDWKDHDSLDDRVYIIHIVWKVSKYGVISGPYFPLFGLNMKIYGVNLSIQSEYRKIRTRNNSIFGHFSCSDRYLHEILYQLYFSDKFCLNWY